MKFLKARSRDLAFKKFKFKNSDFNLKTLLSVHNNNIKHFKREFNKKYNDKHNFSHFQWQSSFNDHIIRDKSDYYTRLNYIKKQWIKHNLKENKFCYISKEIPDFSYTNKLKFTEQ